MFKRLISSLTMDYEFLAKGRNVLTVEEMEMITRGDRLKVTHAEQILTPPDSAPSQDDRVDLAECGVILGHEEELVRWIDEWTRAEIV